MGIADTDRTLAANRMVFDIRRDMLLYEKFRQNIEPVMENYGLSEAEKEAFRSENIADLAKMGIHPYYLPQIARLFHGSGYNHNKSEAAQVYAKNMVESHDG